MATSLLPPTLDEGTVVNLIAKLQQTFYPPPSRGFTVRIGILWALTGAMILLALNYLLLHVLRSKERPRWRSLWLARIVERPGGSYVVLNPRPSWTLTAIMYGFYELLYTGSFWRVYVLHRPQHAWNGIRSFDAAALFIGGWIISWSGLQAFLLAAEAEASLLPSARLANAFFIGGGLLLLALNLGLAIASTVLANNLTQCYEELLAALEGLNQRLAGRVPTLLDFLPIQAPAEAFAQAGDNARIPLVVQFSVIAIMPAAIIAVNLGGLALARTLRAQINNSVELLVRADTHITDLPGQKEEVSEPAAFEIPLVPLASAALEADGNAVEPKEQRKASLTPSESSIRRDRRRSSFAPSECAGPRDRRKSSLTFSAIKQLAVQTDASGRATAARLQARKVLALQKAARDLQIVTLTITFISTCLLGLAIWVAWCAANDKVLRGGFAYVEGTAMPPQWLYSVAVLTSLLYLHYNALVIGRRRFLTDDGLSATASAGAPPGVDRASLICNFADAGSAERGIREAEAQHVGTSEAAGPQRTSAPVSVLSQQNIDIPASRRGSVYSAAGSQRDGGVWRSMGFGRRPKSLTGAAIMVTVEQEQVCDGDTCARWYAQQEHEDEFAPDRRV